MTNYRRCPNGHGYDTDQHTFCPYCTPIASPDPMPVHQVKTTVAPSNENAALNSPPARPHKSDATTVIIGGGDSTSSAPSEYVVGWLVIVNGKGRGRDLRIPPGKCKIGRDKGEITLPFGDDRISREKHAYITYVQKQNSFIIQHGDGKNLVEVNGDPVIGVEKLAPFDRIRLGKTDLIFIPLCGSDFDWSKDHSENISVPSYSIAGKNKTPPAQPQPNGNVKTRLYFED